MGVIILRGIECVHFTWLLFLPSLCTQDVPQIAAHAGSCFSELSCYKLKPLSTSLRIGLQIYSFYYLGCLTFMSFTPMLWFCLGKCKWMQSLQVENSRNEFLNKTPSWKWSRHEETVPNEVQFNSMQSIDSKRHLGTVNESQELYCSNGQLQGIIWTQASSTGRAGSATCPVAQLNLWG